MQGGSIIVKSQNLDAIQEHKYTPQINKNTEKLLQNRNARLLQQKSPTPLKESPYAAKGSPKDDLVKIKPSDKYLL
jgi:hypothetical protein